MTNTEVGPKSWRRLLQSGLDLSLYPFEDVPAGRRQVVLEYSAWHRKQPAVVCFFRDLASGQRYRITVFRDHTTEEYGPEGGVNFAVACPGTLMTLEIHQNRTGTFRILGAQPDAPGGMTCP
jgi:hypothetical protein